MTILIYLTRVKGCGAGRKKLGPAGLGGKQSCIQDKYIKVLVHRS